MRIDADSFRAWRVWRLFLALIWLLAATHNQCQTRTVAGSQPVSSNETKTTPTSSNNSHLNQNGGHLRLLYTDGGRVQIPGLYEDPDGGIIPIRGEAQFNKLILGLNQDEHNSEPNATGSSHLCQATTANERHEAIRAAAQSEQISLVQFYMASCPDCQGFSPYFKRFSRDISQRWRKMVKIYTVNCNDFLNIHLCQEQNPRLIVPMIRWYVFPTIQRDHLQARTTTGSNRTDYGDSQFGYPEELLNIAHRQFISKQRRDLISLRRATIRFIELTLDELSNDSHRAISRHSSNRLMSTPKSSRRLFYESLPIAWHQLQRAGFYQQDELDDEEQFVQDVNARVVKCIESLRLEAGDCTNGTLAQSGIELRNFVVFENRRSFIGRTLVADWSSSMCTRRMGTNQTQLPFVLHRSIDLGLVTRGNMTSQLSQRSEPYLLAFNVSSNLGPIKSARELGFELVAWNGTETAATLVRPRRAAHKARPERVQQRALLQEYYSRSREIPPIRYAEAMSSTRERRRGGSRTIRKRDVRGNESEARLLKQAELENVNWVPEFVYAGEERVRRSFNERLAKDLGRPEQSVWPEAFEWGEIQRAQANKTAAISATEDDLSLMFLTDYYRALDEMVHIDLLSKGAVDGYQLLASCCFLRDIERLFPFQGNAFGSEEIGSKSVARHYIQLIRSAWLDSLRERIPNGGLTSDGLLNSCAKLTDSLKSNSSRIQLDRIRVPGKELEQLQLKVERTNQLGLPPERHLKWKYCAGSAAYLRGHTCSLWILFHTLTVQDYLKSSLSEQQTDEAEYKFQVDYSRPPRRSCDPQNPDTAYLASNTSELFIGETKFVLANIINFVRFYLPCTNCAAHFNCMVEHSPGLRFDSGPEAAPERHLLWLWEAHNRVNERTRGTHSEDPLRPKHIFPSFGACPHCYLTEPKPDDTFVSMHFNQRHLVKFLVARYRRSAILNNQINIEDLYRKP